MFGLCSFNCFCRSIIKKEDTTDKAEFLINKMSCRISDGKFLNNGVQMKHKKSHEPTRLFQCTLCKKTYSKADHLKRHMLSHTGEKPHKCDSCEKRFTTRGQLVVHHRTHTNERPFKCTECDMAFRQIGHLKQHNRQHTSRRLSIGVGYERTQESQLYICNVCNKSFTTNRWLKSHTRIFHTGETPYKCKHCYEEFPSHQKYYYHMKSNHEECKHKCPDCGKSFAISWNLNSHRLLHASNKHYVCSECDVRFLYAKDLKIHLLRHYGSSQTCHVCGQVLSNPLRLKLHISNHLLPKLFVCGECGKQFPVRAAVIKHFDWCHTQKYSKSNLGSIRNKKLHESKLK